MKSTKRLFSVAMATALVAGCASTPPADTQQQAASGAQSLLGMSAPLGRGSGSGESSGIEWAEMIEMAPVAAVAINLQDVIAAGTTPNQDIRESNDRMESPISEEQAALLREQAMNLPEQQVQAIGEALPGQEAPVPGTSWDSIDYNDCCGGGGSVPPDPEMAAGPDHVVAVVNVAFQFYDKTGAPASPVVTFADFFSVIPACAARPFDPNAIYDEKEDRYILAADGNGEFYCIAVSQTNNAVGSYWLYAFPTNVGGNFFDYPHAGVGDDAIYMGANLFGVASFAEARVWALDKFAMYAGAPAAAVTWSTGFDSTPQPMNLHGWAQGTWPPPGGPHYILTDNNFDGNVYSVWSWTDPFGANNLVEVGTFDLAAFTGVTGGFPIDTPQAGSGALLQANDWRVQDAEYRNGSIWMTHTLSMNPGGGTVNAARWAQIDPTGPTVQNAGVVVSEGEHRIFADLAVNDCDDMAVGYTKSSTGMFPSVYVTGRLGTDPIGAIQPETEVKAGEITYTAFDGSPHRWGDYSGMTIDPDGQTFWYLGEYSKITGNPNGRWGNYIGSFSFPSCGGGPFFNKTIIFGNDVDNNTVPDLVIDVDGGQSNYGFVIDYFDPAGTPVRVKDVVPEYWGRTRQIGGPPCNVVRADETRNLFSATHITCQSFGDDSWAFEAISRPLNTSSGTVFEPTECGAFYLNEGAGAFAGRSLYMGPTDPICLAAVKDLNGGGLDYTGNGDEDGDGVSDYQEACVDFTDPCVADD